MKKVLRSLIQEKFPLELRVQIDLLSRRRDIVNKEKQDELLKLLRENSIEGVVPLGPGTNRYAFKLDGFVIKVATDHDGKIDNFKEFKMAKRLFPYVSKIYEVSDNGTLLVAEYIQPFESFTEMCKYSEQIRDILTKLSSVYLIGDVGITSKNYANWGLRVGTNTPVCFDFAYVYEVSSELFICRKCKVNAMLVPNRDFTELYCSNPACKAKYTFEDIRGRIGNDLHNHEIGDLSTEGYVMTDSNVPVELDPERSNYLNKLNKPKKVKKEVINEEENNSDLNEKEDFVMKTEELKVTGVAKVKGDSNQSSSEWAKVDDLLKIKSTVPGKVVVKGSAKIKGSSDLPDVNSVPFATDKPLKSNMTAEEKDAYEMQKYMRKSSIALSVLSNCIRDTAKDQDLFDDIAKYINPRSTKEDFYKSFQNSVFKSLGEFLGFEDHPTDIEGRTKHHYILNEEVKKAIIDETSPIYGTFIFMSQFNEIYEHENHSNNIDYICQYVDDYDEYSMIQPEWIEYFKKYFTKKLPINNVGYDLVVNYLKEVWISSDPDEDEEEPEEAVQEEQENDLPDVSLNNDEEESEEDFEGPEDADYYVEKDEHYPEPDRYEDKDYARDVDQEEDDEEEENEEEEGEEEYDEQEPIDNQYLRVLMFRDPDQGLECIKFCAIDGFGNIDIPVYCNIDEYLKDLNKEIDDINGINSWLTTMVPDLLFKTDRPQYWLENINGPEEDWFYTDTHAAFLGVDEESGLSVIGLYYIDGIFEVDGDMNYNPCTNVDMIKAINLIVLDNISFTKISHAKRSLAIPEIIYDEEYILQNIKVNETDVVVDEEFEGEDITGKMNPPIDDEESEEEEVNKSAADYAASLMADDEPVDEEVEEDGEETAEDVSEDADQSEDELDSPEPEKKGNEDQKGNKDDREVSLKDEDDDLIPVQSSNSSNTDEEDDDIIPVVK